MDLTHETFKLMSPSNFLHVITVIRYIDSLEGKTIYEMFFPHKNLLRVVSESVHKVVIPKLELKYCSSSADCIIFAKEKELKFTVTTYSGKDDICLDIYADNSYMACSSVPISIFVHNQKDFV